MSITTENEQLAYIASQAADARVNVEVETDEGMHLIWVLNIRLHMGLSELSQS